MDIEVEPKTQDVEEAKAEIASTEHLPPEEQAEALEVVQRKYSDEEILQAIEELEKESYVGRLLSMVRKGEEPKNYEISEDDVNSVLQCIANEDGAGFVDCLQEIARKGSENPAIDIVGGWIKKDNEIGAKRKLKKFLKGLEIDGEIGYDLGDDDDISSLDSEDFMNSPYGKTLKVFADNDIRTLKQLAFNKDKFSSALNDGLKAKLETKKDLLDGAKIKGAIVAPTGIDGGAVISKETVSFKDKSPEELKKIAKEFLSKGDYKGLREFQKKQFD